MVTIERHGRFSGSTYVCLPWEEGGEQPNLILLPGSHFTSCVTIYGGGGGNCPPPPPPPPPARYRSVQGLQRYSIDSKTTSIISTLRFLPVGRFIPSTKVHFVRNKHAAIDYIFLVTKRLRWNARALYSKTYAQTTFRRVIKN